jgi:uncharacterized Zn finger protein
MTPESKKWFDAGYILQKDPTVVVKCPKCNIGALEVKDEPINSGDNRIDRYLICNNCGAWNVITMQLPKPEDFD